MEPKLEPDSIFRFGAFELDLRIGELRKNGLRVRLQDAPFRALRLFISQPQQILTRQDIRQALWPDGVFVDFDRGINTTINRLREALGDTSRNPIFIETVARSGYRWIAPVQLVPHDDEEPGGTDPEKRETARLPELSPSWSLYSRIFTAGLIFLLLAISTGAASWIFRQPPPITAASAKTRNTNKWADPQAQELYLLGRYHWSKRTPDDLTQAVSYFNQAIDRDPDYADAYVGLSDCYSLLREFGNMRSEEALPKAFAAARKAVQLDDTSAEAHNALAFVTFYWNWDAPGAEREFRRAIELNPRYVTAHHWYATFLMTLGRFPEALKEINDAQQLDPASTPILADKALILFHSGKKPAAISLLTQVSASQPAFFSTHQYLAYIYLNADNSESFLQEARAAARLSRDAQQLKVLNAGENGYRTGGEQAMLLSMARLQEKYFQQGTLPAFTVARTYAQLGRKNETLKYLNTSLERHEVAFLSARVDEPFAYLHDDTSFRNLIVQAGLPSFR